MPKDHSYLADAEASQLLTQAIPGALVLQLRRDGGREPGTRMFIELTVGEAVQHWRQMGELIRRAGAMEREAAHGDASPNL